MDKKVEKANKAIKKEETEIKKEARAEDKVNQEVEKKKEEEEKAHPWKTDPAKEVDIISSFLKNKEAGTYQKSLNATIHDHPVWIKVQPEETRFGYYQQKKWIITDIKHLKPMLDEAVKFPKKDWENALATSLNEVEDFPDAIWKDDKGHHLKPKTISDAKVETSYEEPKLDNKGSNNDDDEAPEEPAKEEEKEEKEEEKKPEPKKEEPKPKAAEPPKPSDSGAKATKQHEEVKKAKEAAEKKVAKALKKVQKEKGHLTELKGTKLKHIATKKPKKSMKPMGSARCFIITLDTPAGLVLQVDPFDKYRPRKTGVYNVHLAKLMADKSLKDPLRKL